MAGKIPGQSGLQIDYCCAPTTAGEYTVTVGDSSMSLTVETETIMGINIGADYVFPLANQDLQVSFYNQYGEPMTIVGANIFVFADNGVTLSPQNMGTTIKVDASGSNLDTANTITINIFHLATGLNSVKSIPLYDEPEVKTFYIAGLEIADAAARIEENTSGHKLVIEATDQYGMPYILTNADIQAGGDVIVLNSGEASVPSISFFIDAEGKLVFNALAAGEATITFLVPTEAIVRNYSITVSEPTTLESLLIYQGSGMITSGTRHDLLAFAYDQLGTPISLKGNFDFSKFSMFSTAPLSISNTAIQYDAIEGIL